MKTERVKWKFLSLSSGWDSTSILAALIKIKGKRKISCFIGRMKFSKKSKIINNFEIARAKKIAQYYNVNLKIVDLDYTKRSARESVSSYINVLKKYHLVSLPALNQMKLCEKISQNYTKFLFTERVVTVYKTLDLVIMQLKFKILLGILESTLIK